MSEYLTDPSAERGVLSGIFQYCSSAFVDVDDLLDTETFTIDSNQIIYNCFSHILKDDKDAKIDLPSLLSVANDLKYKEFFNNPEEKKYIRALQNFPIKLENVRKLAAKIRKLQITRMLVNQVDECKINLRNITGSESISQILGLVENPILDFSMLLNDGNQDGPVKMGDGIDDYISYLIENPRDMVGISTGYSQYDLAIGGGLRRKTVNLIGARPKVGKTFLGDNISLHIAGKLNIPTLNLDTEMSIEDHWNRIIANLSNVDIDDIETGKFSKNPTKKERVLKAAEYLKSIPYDYISIAGKPFEETISIVRRWLLKNVGTDENGEIKDCVIVYDYLKLMSSDGLSEHMREYQMLGFQMTTLHNFTVKYNIPCLAFIQLNRDGITKESTDVVSGSDRLIWLCSNFSIFKEKSEEEIADEGIENGNRKLIPVIARHGEGLSDGDYINMKMEGKVGRITQGKTRNELHNLSQENPLDNQPVF